MLGLVTGTDKSAVRNYIKSVRVKFAPQSIEEFSVGYNKNDFIDSINTENIFFKERLVVLSPAKAEEVEFDDKFLEELSQNKSINLLVDGSQLVKTSGAYKKLKKFAKYTNFDQARDYTQFNLSDAMFIYQNRKQVVEILNTIDVDADFYSIISTFQGALRNIISRDEKNETWEKLHPFVKKKIAQSKLAADDAKRLYLKLFLLDTDLKSKAVSKRSLVEDFVLYSL